MTQGLKDSRTNERAKLGVESGLTPLNHRPDGLLDLLAGQCPFGMPKYHAEMDALLILWEIPAPEGIQVMDGFQGRAGRSDHGVGQFRPQQISCQDQGKVAGHGGERWQG